MLGLAPLKASHYGVAMSTKEALLRDIESFLAKTGISPTRLGEDSCGERGLIRRLQRGGDVTTETHDRIRAYMHARRHERPKLRGAYQPAA